GARVLILDEPTSVLAPGEIDGLLRTIRALSAAGLAVMFISHKLSEVLAVADRIAVLRRGKLVQLTTTKDTSAAQLAEAVMTAPDESTSTSTSTSTPTSTSTSTSTSISTPTSTAPPRLLIRDLRCEDSRGRPALRGLSFHVQPGGVLGIAGVDGNGQTELAEALTGLRHARGTLLLDGEDGLRARGWARSPGAARRAGIVHLPEDRRGRALCLPM